MNPWLDWGIPIITWLQGLGDWLTAPMEFFTTLGTEQFYLLVMPALLWCYDARMGVRLGFILVASDGLNGLLKLALGAPRPYWVTDQVRALASETSFGAPSGHAQNAAALWGRAAAWIGRGWATVLLVLLILLIAASRWYLGVHYPMDGLLGLAAGGLLLWAFLRWENRLGQRLGRLPVARQVALAFAVSLAVIALELAVFALTAGRQVPHEWFARAAAASANPIDPRSLEPMFTTGGLIFGFGTGAVLLLSWGQFDAKGIWWKRAARFVVGLIGVIALWMGLDMLFPAGQAPLALALRYVRYAAVGLWAVYLAPRAFVWMKLA
jgi:membrane-associated phospholipid phosphatase